MNYLTDSKKNHFDNLVVDVKSLYRRFPLTSLHKDKTDSRTFGSFRFIYRFPLLPISLRSFLWYLLHRLGIDTGWFNNFREYWRRYLGGLPLWSPQDFYFLRSIYRLKFQYSKVPNTNDARAHLRSWQKPEILYHLFDMAFRESLFNQVSALQLYSKYKNNDLKDPILEFGCGTAPVATSFVDFFGTKRKIYICDLETIYFHYAAYKFRNMPNIVPMLLVPSHKFLPTFTGKVSAIFCMTVFEHLDHPISVVKKFHELLQPGGLLIFDYIKADGKGMDTIAGVREREAVFSFIRKNFRIIHGATELSEGTATIVAQRL